MPDPDDRFAWAMLAVLALLGAWSLATCSVIGYALGVQRGHP